MSLAAFNIPNYATPVLPIPGKRTPWWPVLFSLPFLMVKLFEWYLTAFLHSRSNAENVQTALTYAYIASPVISVIGVGMSITAMCLRRRTWQLGLFALLANLLSLLVMAVAGLVYFVSHLSLGC